MKRKVTMTRSILMLLPVFLFCCLFGIFGTKTVHANEELQVTQYLNDEVYDEESYYRFVVGESVTMKVEVTGTSDTDRITYQWRKLNEDNGIFEDLVDETNVSYCTQKLPGEITYCCVISMNGVPSYTYNYNLYPDNSLELSLEINEEEYDGWYGWYQSIRGEELLLSVNASSTYEEGRITYQWYDSSMTELNGENGSVYRMTKDSGSETYSCKVTDGNITEWCYFYIVPTNTLSITSYINDRLMQECNYKIGEAFTLRVEADSDYDSKNITYQWYKQTVTDNGDAWLELKDEDNNPETNDTYVGIKVDREEVYRCKVDDGNEDTYVTFRLKPEKTLSGIQYIGEKKSSTQTCKKGDSVTMRVEATSSLNPDNITYQWVDEDDNTLGFESSFTATKGIGEENFYCIVSDGNYEVMYTFLLKPEQTLTVVRKIDGEKGYVKCVTVDEDVTLSVDATSIFQENSETHFTYDWDGEYLDGEQDVTKSSITVQRHVTTYDWGSRYETQYSCTVSDGNETKTVYFYLNPTDTISEKQYINSQEGKRGSFTKGTKVTMRVEATSSFAPSDLSYKWYYINSDEEMETISTTDSAEVEITSEKKYYNCKISDGNCEKIVYFCLTQQHTVSATQYINDVEADYLELTGDGPITLRVEAETSLPDATLEYQWSIYDEETDSEQNIPNATSDCIKVSAFGEYYCDITDGEDEIRCEFYLSNASEGSEVIAYVNDEIVEFDDYLCKEIAAGDQVELKVEVISSSEETIRYQWYYLGSDPYDYDDKQEISDVETNTYSFTKGQDREVYQCIIYAGEEQIYHRTFVLEDASLSAETYINGNNIDEYTGAPGEEITLQVQAESLTGKTLSYQWYSFDDDENKVLISSEGNQYSFSLSDNSDYEELYFYCNVTDGSLTKSYKFTVYKEVIEIWGYINGKEKSSENIDPGSDVTLSIQTSLEDVTYQWGRYVDYIDEYEWIPISGATESSLSCENVLSDGRYACRVTHGGITEDYSFYLWVNCSLKGKQYIDGQEINEMAVAKDDTVQLMIDASSLLPDKTISYSWFDGLYNKVGEGSSYQATKSTDQTEVYRCKVSDGYCTENYIFYLKPGNSLIVNAYINGQFTGIIDVNSGQEVTLEIKATAGDTPITYQWYRSKNMINYEKCDNTTPTYTDTPGETTWYYCIVRAGTSTQRIDFTVEVDDEHIHTVVIDQAVAPTCTTEGKTEGSHCSECHAIIKKQKPIAALGHKWDSGIITKQPTSTATGIKTYTCTVCKATKTEVIAALGVTSNPVPKTDTIVTGTVLTDTGTEAVYRVLSNNQVEYVKPVSIKASVTIPSTVTINGVKYNVTSIAPNAFKGNKKLKKIVIPSTITKIGSKAFYGCKNLKSINIKSTKLTSKSFGSKALKGIHAKATIKVPKKKLKAYKKILKKAGVSGKVKIK